MPKATNTQAVRSVINKLRFGRRLNYGSQTNCARANCGLFVVLGWLWLVALSTCLTLLHDMTAYSLLPNSVCESNS